MNKTHHLFTFGKSISGIETTHLNSSSIDKFIFKLTSSYFGNYLEYISPIHSFIFIYLYLHLLKVPVNICCPIKCLIAGCKFVAKGIFCV